MTNNKEVADVQRRKFLTRAASTAVASVAMTGIPTQSNSAPELARVAYPVSRIGHLTDLKVRDPQQISYPDSESPGLLIKLGVAVEGGVGPDGDVVAYSTQCPHKGFSLFYRADDQTLNCPGHYSRYDCERSGLLVWGHATQNLPQFRLRVTTDGDILAEGVDELIYGRTSNILA